MAAQQDCISQTPLQLGVAVEQRFHPRDLSRSDMSHLQVIKEASATLLFSSCRLDPERNSDPAATV